MTILIYLMGYDVIAPFTFSGSAALNTSIVFLIIFLVTSFQGYRLIYQFKLIDLFPCIEKGGSGSEAIYDCSLSRNFPDCHRILVGDARSFLLLKCGKRLAF
ncbi:hypothetical protein RCO48_04805 [Peribacillus frigoritolerans]|nr:hypothetical protein [Peribacillus frigoritolerans]